MLYVNSKEIKILNVSLCSMDDKGKLPNAICE